MPLFEDTDQHVHAISSCTDVYHRDCLTQYVKSQIEQGKLPVRCPDMNCMVPLSTENDLKSLLNEQELARLQRFEWKMIRESCNPADYLDCPTDNCDYFFARDGEKEVRKHDCPSCGVSYCYKCQMPYHTGFTCAEYAARERAEEINNAHLEEDDQLEQWA